MFSHAQIALSQLSKSQHIISNYSDSNRDQMVLIQNSNKY